MHPTDDSPAPTTLEGELDVLRIEDAIARRPGVDAVRMVPGRHRPVEELHVVVAPDSSHDAVRRDVQALLLDRFQLPVDWHAIRTVPRPRTASPNEPVAAPTRLVLETVNLALRGRDTTVQVELRDGEALVDGTAGPVPAHGLLRGVADAAAAAVARHVDRGLDVASAEVVPAGADRVALVTLVASDGRGRQQLTGSAIVHGTDADAVARAVLDATNRLPRG